MDKFIVKILKTIDKYNMIPKGSTVIAAVSGGYDSLCMLCVLNEIKKIRGFNLAAVHVNHSLRDAADSDMEYVVKTAESLGVTCKCLKADVSGYAEKNGISFETAGREIRYKFFAETAENYENALIATAHNANDSAESFFMHLLRGSGLNGLCGIAAVRGNIIRPLIETSRPEIEAYCDSHGIVPVHDITNDSDDYTRNDIRHNVMPCILSRCSIDSLLRTMEIIRSDETFCENYVKTVAKNIVLDYNGISKINIKQFNSLDKSVRRRILYGLLKDSEKQAGLIHIDSIIALAENNRGGSTVKLPGRTKITVSKGMLEFYEQ